MNYSGNTIHELLKSSLSSIEKPAQYIGNEFNAVNKDFNNSIFRIVISYPDLYEIGMSNLAIKILYELINKNPNYLCERVFHPRPDFVKILKEKEVPLFSLESHNPINTFDMIGFSLGYELSYTSVLSILNLGKIPIFNIDRSDKDPIVIAGGPCTTNPLPMSSFIDLFVIGEGEEVVFEIIDKYKLA